MLSLCCVGVVFVGGSFGVAVGAGVGGCCCKCFGSVGECGGGPEFV